MVNRRKDPSDPFIARGVPSSLASTISVPQIQKLFPRRANKETSITEVTCGWKKKIKK